MESLRLCEGSGVWDGSSIRSCEQEWLQYLDDQVLHELEIMVQGGTATSAGMLEIRAADFNLRVCGLMFEAIRTRLENGPGFVLLRGLPVERYSLEELELMLWGIGLHVGTAVKQDQAGTLLAHVCDREDGYVTAGASRGYQTNAHLPFHTDRCDVLVLFCIHPAREGGLSMLASAGWIHNQLAMKYPQFRPLLYTPMPQDLRDAVLYGSKPWASIPIFSFENYIFASRYLRRFTETSQRFEDAPRLATEQIEVLDAIDTVLADPANTLSFPLKPGDLLFINNFTVWHSRTRFTDWEDPARKRLLLRLWLSPPNSRRLPESFLPLYGAVEPGAVRGGFP